MTTYTSDKIRIISLFSIVLVVFLHAYNLDNYPSDTPLFHRSGVWFLEDIVSQGFTRVAVPLFFLLSSYLYFLNTDGKIAGFLVKMKKRVRTLLVPFLFWSLFGIVFYFTLQSIPQSAPFFTKGHVVNFSLQQWLQTIFITPIPYQLWFLRDLIVLVALSPVLYFLVRNFWKFSLAFAFILWIVVPANWQNSSEALLFFLIGASISVHKPEIATTKRSDYALLLLATWVVLVLLKSASHYTGWPAQVIVGVYKLSILIGIAACWKLYDFIYGHNDKGNSGLLQLSAFTFFVYAAHEPMLTVVKKGLFAVLGKSEMNYLGIYIIAPITVIICCMVLALFLKKYGTAFYEFITGGR